MAQSACLRLGALLVVVVVVVGDWAACPSLLLQSRSCIMTPIRSTLFHSGMRSLCSSVTDSRTGLSQKKLVVQLHAPALCVSGWG